MVCSQALTQNGLSTTEVASDVTVTLAALRVIAQYQSAEDAVVSSQGIVLALHKPDQKEAKQITKFPKLFPGVGLGHRRLAELDKEWGPPQTNFSVLSLVGAGLASKVNKCWAALPVGGACLYDSARLTGSVPTAGYFAPPRHSYRKRN